MLKCKKDAVTSQVSLGTIFVENKKGIGPVVATALLIVVSVVAVIGFQTWFGTYSSDLFVKTEKDSSSTSNTNIETLIGDQLYFKNTLDDNISIKQIKIGNKECNISLNLTKGVHNISLGNCTNNLTLSSSVSDVVVITDKKVYTKKHLFKDVNIASQSVSSPIPPVVSSYELNNSLLFDGVDDYLSWTPTQEGNRTTWTWSGWVKLTDKKGVLYSAGIDSNSKSYIYYDTFDLSRYYITYYNRISGIASLTGNTDAKIRDYSDWIHITTIYDSTELIASNKIKHYFNGIRVNSFVNHDSLNQKSYINGIYNHILGAHIGLLDSKLDGYMSEINFIDGQALTPTDFGEFNNYEKWIPKEYNGTYGQNGFHLTFENSSNLGQDFSGNNNSWTVNGGPVQTIDNPTNNFATLNPLYKSAVYNPIFSKGNTKVSYNTRSVFSRFSFEEVPIGKWYFEGILSGSPTAQYTSIGIIDEMRDGYGYSYFIGGECTYNDPGIEPYGDSYTSGDIIGVAVDNVDEQIEFFKNGISQGVINFVNVTNWAFRTQLYEAGVSWEVNFGATPFQYPIPEGYKTLSSKNLPTPKVVPSQGFDVLTYTGTGSNQNIEGLDFSPSLVWIKNRDQTDSHKLFDILRGPTKYIESDSTNVQTTNTNSLTSFNLDGFTLGTGANGFNDLNEKFVAWNWKEGPEFGFDIVNYTGNGGSNRAISHNLNNLPEMIFVYGHSQGGTSWQNYHKDIGPGYTMFLDDGSLGQFSDTSVWNNQVPNNESFYVGNSVRSNNNGESFITYLFTSISGFSKIGSYTGNGNADGPFVYTGFKPKYIMIKNADGSSNWMVEDSIRDINNPVLNRLELDNPNIEASSELMDFLSNGFKIRTTGGINTNSNKFIYIAFAEYPLSTNY